MRGADFSQNVLFVTVTVEDFVPSNHPLRARTAKGNIPPGNRGGGNLLGRRSWLRM